MHRTDTVVIGAGQAGLATSSLLVAAGLDHVVLERGRIGERWRSERWDSLRLLTPNWMTRLPGHRYDGDDPDGFMPAAELADRFQRYASGFDAPVRTGTPVRSVRPAAGEGGYVVATEDGTWFAREVVVASGFFAKGSVPPAASDLHPSVHQLHSSAYRRPDDVPDGRVLVVGASASGAQLADELAGAGRDVVLAVGAHTRLPRTYRGRDILWWLDRMGRLDERTEDLPPRAKQQPSMQLAGRPARDDLDLGTLAARGVQITGRLASISGRHVRFDGDLATTTADADRRLRRLLERIDAHAAACGPTGLPPAPPFRPIDLPPGATELDLGRAGITSVVWATGHRPDFPWVQVPGVLDASGAVRHDRGVTPSPGLYVVGMRWQTRRSSTFIDGVRHDATAVVDHLLARHRHPAAA